MSGLTRNQFTNSQEALMLMRRKSTVPKRNSSFQPLSCVFGLCLWLSASNGLRARVHRKCQNGSASFLLLKASCISLPLLNRSIYSCTHGGEKIFLFFFFFSLLKTNLSSTRFSIVPVWTVHGKWMLTSDTTTPVLLEEQLNRSTTRLHFPPQPMA